MDADKQKNVMKEIAKPVMKNKVGNFQISLWKKKFVFPAQSDFDCEREVELVRVCIQFISCCKKTQSWENQSIRRLSDDLRDLAAVLSQLFEEKGDDVSPSPPS